MRRGLPRDGSSAREARIRRAAPPARGRSSGSPASTSWWHQPLLWLMLLASLPLVNAAVPGPADWLSWPYVWARPFGTALCAFLALWMSYRLALGVAKSPAALLATIAIWLASSLPVYLYVLPSAAQVVAMFSAALMLTFWRSVRDGRDSRVRWFAWGLAAGLAIATSSLNGALLIVALIECVTRMARPRGFVPAFFSGLVFLAGVAAVALPWLAIERQIPIFHWTSPQLFATAFSTEHGAFLWTPILLSAILGFAVAIRRQPAFGTTLFLTGALFFYLVAAHDGGLGDASYGSRFLVTITPIFVCGLAALLDALVGSRGRIAWTAAASIAALLVLWNLGLMLQWGTGLIPNRGPVDFRRAAANQVTVVPRAARDFVIRYLNDRKGLLNKLGGGARE